MVVKPSDDPADHHAIQHLLQRMAHTSEAGAVAALHKLLLLRQPGWAAAHQLLILQCLTVLRWAAMSVRTVPHDRMLRICRRTGLCIPHVLPGEVLQGPGGGVIPQPQLGLPLDAHIWCEHMCLGQLHPSFWLAVFKVLYAPH